MTYSIVARDPETGELGGAVQSHYFAVGRRCLTIVPGVAAIASQALGSAAHGPLLAEAVAAGTLPADALRDVLADDENSPLRQVSIAAARGTAAHTGDGCIPVATHAIGEHAVAAGNTLTGPHAAAMLAAFDGTSGPLEHRMLAALDAAQAAGGDARGVMSAALKVVAGTPTRWPQDGTRLDLRVDHSDDPLGELHRLTALGTAHGQLSSAVLAPGRLVGSGAEPITSENADAVLERLGAVQEAFGTDPEPTFWRGVVASRAGRPDLAAQYLAAVIAARPEYAALAEGLARVGRLELPLGGLSALLESAPLDSHRSAASRTAPTEGEIHS